MDDFFEESSPWSDLKKRYIDHLCPLPRDISLSLENAFKRSQLSLLAHSLLDRAIEIAVSKGLTAEDGETKELMMEATTIANDLGAACHYPRLPYSSEELKNLEPRDAYRKLSITHPTPTSDLLEEAKVGKYHVVDLDAFQSGVSKYLESKFRTQVADRLILVSLFDCEITAYLKHVFEVDIFTKRSVASSHRKPFTAWLVGRAWGVVFQALTIALIIGLRYLDWISADTCIVLILLSIAFFLLGTAISIPMYFSYKKSWKSKIPAIVDIPKDMIQLYRETHDSGPLSVKRVRKLAEALADKGASWPSGSWAMLDDLDARGIVALKEI